MRARRTQREKRREEILQSALRAFARKSYMRVTTKELAAEAGLSEPALYKYFHGKRQLFVTLIETIGRRMIERWTEVAADSADGLEALHDIGVHHFERVLRNRDYTRVMFQAISEVSDAEIRAAVEHVYASFVQHIARLVRRAMREGRIKKEVDVPMVAWHFLSLGFTLNLIGLVGFRQQFTGRNLDRWGLPLFEYLRGNGSGPVPWDGHRSGTAKTRKKSARSTSAIKGVRS